MRKRVIFLIILSLSLWAVSGGSAQAQEPLKSAEIFLSPEQDMVFEGLRARHITWFNIPYSVASPVKGELQLFFTYSDILMKGASSITVLINDVPIESIDLAGREHKGATVIFPIEGDQLKPGANSLQIDFYAQAHQNVCEDIDNPANWYVVSKESVLRLYYQADFNIDLKYFPEPLARMGRFTGKGITFVMDNELIDLYSNSAMQIGMLAPDSVVEINCARSGHETEKDNLFAIGTKGKLPLGLGEGKSPGKDQAIYAIRRSPRAAGSALFSISAGNNKCLKSAVAILSSPELKKELSGKERIVDPFSREYQAKDALDIFYRKRTFKELGFGDEVIRGSFYSERSYYFTVPPSWKLSANSSINFVVDLAPLLDPDKSEMSVFVNGKYAGSTRLAGVRNKPFVFSVNIPQEVLNQRGFDILARFYLDIGQTGCEGLYPGKAWVIIQKDSLVLLSYREKEVFFLADFPGQYMQDNKIDLPLVVIPDIPDNNALTALLRFSFALGQFLPPFDGWLDIKKAGEITEEDKKRHLVVIGTGQSNAFFSAINPELPISFNREDSQPFISQLIDKDALAIPTDYRWSLPVDFREEMGCVEIIRSPWNPDKTVMVISGTDGYLLLDAADIFFNRTLLYDTDANVAIIDGAGGVTPYKTLSEERVEKMKEEALRTRLPIFLALVIVAIFAVVIILYFTHRK